MEGLWRREESAALCFNYSETPGPTTSLSPTCTALTFFAVSSQMKFGICLSPKQIDMLALSLVKLLVLVPGRMLEL